MKILVVVYILHLFLHISAFSWLTVGLAGSQVDLKRISTTCKNLRGLNRKQIKFCRQNPRLMRSIQTGAKDAYTECQFQFYKRRWNCSLINPSSRELINGVLLSEGTRESAFVHALSSAAVAYKVTRDCARGLNGDQCGCDISKRQGFDLMGCSDHIQYGIAISREFVDAAEKSKNRSNDPDTNLVNLHNNRAGRQVLEKSLRRECKCHGMSGSCEVKTCWESMPSFREIGSIIKDKFDGASEVNVVEEDEKQKIIMKHTHFKRHTNADLVYLKPSPDFCDADSTRGILGTRGRECNIASQGVDGCQIMCCNRGYERKVSYVKDKCNCKFHYCCRVECDECERVEEKFYCL
ncbi:unnamed protein product [Auanema sp. JU1783]|nr:unnamed protein product [Auanema sp. JU1783]